MTAPVVFDLDGTLIDSLPGIAWAANETLDAFGTAPLPQARIAGFVGHGEQVFVDRLIAASGLEAPRPEIMARFLVFYAQAAERTTLFSGALEALDWLRGQGVPIGLCTNKPSGPLEPVLRALDLAARFDVIVAGDSLPMRKPDPEPLRHALRALGAARGLYVGDSEVDAETAQRAGQPFALFTEGIRQSPVEALPHDWTFHDFGAFPAVYKAFLGA
jgi:phosphoglycolate phosphatase